MGNPHTEGLGRLIERLEREQPNRELANEVLLACGWTYAYEMERGTKVEYWRSPSTPPGQCEQYPLPNPLSSLDAAASLDCGPHTYACGDMNENESCWACVTTPDGTDYTGEAFNVPAALTIAKLKARAASEGK